MSIRDLIKNTFLAAALAALLCRGALAQDFVALEDTVRERADSIMIPCLELKENTFGEALKLLRLEAVRRDPSRVGIEIVSKSRSNREYVPLDMRVTLSLRDVSLLKALGYVSSLVGCQPVVTVKGIDIVPLEVSTERMITHTIPLPSAIFREPAAADRRRVDKIRLQKMRGNLKQFFIDGGVSFSPNASCSFEADGMTIVVTNTKEQLDLVHVILEGLIEQN